jgi:hypothetical protein
MSRRLGALDGKSILQQLAGAKPAGSWKCANPLPPTAGGPHAVRAHCLALMGGTAAAAMIGAAFILTDPIFQRLAISLVFGLASSTAITVLVIPAIYVWLRDDSARRSLTDHSTGPGINPASRR